MGTVVGRTLGGTMEGRNVGRGHPAGMITGRVLCLEDHGGCLGREDCRGHSEGGSLREHCSGEDRGGHAEGSFLSSTLPSGSCGFLYALVCLTLVSSINLARSTLILVNIYLVICARLQAKRLTWISSLHSQVSLEEVLLFSL